MHQSKTTDSMKNHCLCIDKVMPLWKLLNAGRSRKTNVVRAFSLTELVWVSAFFIVKNSGMFLTIWSIFLWNFFKLFESKKCLFKNVSECFVSGLALQRWILVRPCGWDKMTKVGGKWFPAFSNVVIDLCVVGQQINGFVLEKLISISFIVPLK